MGKKKQFIKIGGETFTIVKGAGNPVGRYKDIMDAYDNPSCYKINIWHYWHNWFINNFELWTDYIEISSKNSMIFTICGVITVKDISYGFYITKTRNEVWSL